MMTQNNIVFICEIFSLPIRTIKQSQESGCRLLRKKSQTKPELIKEFSEILAIKKAELKDEQYEKIFLRGLCSYMKGIIDSNKFEEFCKPLFGQDAYLFFSIDKLISSIVKTQEYLGEEINQNFLLQKKQPSNQFIKIVKTIQQRFVGEEIFPKIWSLFEKAHSVPEVLYYSYYNRIMVDNQSNQHNFFRFLFNSDCKILSIHYYESPFGQLDCNMLEDIRLYYEKSIVGRKTSLSVPGIF